ncbi:ATP-binding protein [Cecembia rubra]|uniref:Uncharacterized protein DUF87 n=1 Tax=Cecembia rubra TaxID=1485585 RepID=A0A2P8DVJ0_9BACT|nr:DUF87 domain-containing protein [Cecembia rubra]PSL01229.1 uncharacterized protein DUF87 [Cecembia rubra]
MSIKFRIILLALQVLILSFATYLVTGQFAVNEVWYFSGLLAIVINPLLLEPWYPKSYDTLANSIIAILLCFVVSPNVAIVGWTFLKVFLAILIITSIIQLVYNAKKEKEDNIRLKALFPLFKLGKATVIYSLVFWLSVIELYPTINNNFWILGGCWALLTFTRFINWEEYFLDITDKPTPVSPIGIIGPSNLLVTSRSLQKVGTKVKVVSGSLVEKGIIVKRIHRTDDVWGQIQLDNDSKIGFLVSRQQLVIQQDEDSSERVFLGNVDEGTNTSLLVFDSYSRIRIGDTIYLMNDGEVVFYQIIQAEVIKLIIKSGSQLDRRIKAIQIGTYKVDTQSLHINKMLPLLSEPIFLANNDKVLTSKLKALENKFTIGKIKNSELPINLDLLKIMESHMAILGMTGMGKTTLCNKLIQELSKTRRVTVMDQSGEFVSKLGYEKYKEGDDTQTTGVSVCEPSGNPAESALKYLNHLMALAKKEYQEGTPKPRVLVIDEAHQFIPEPAGLGFNSPGREESMKFGLNMMQVRKYGISIIFISQRTAVVSKRALSQCENLIAFKSVDQTGLDYLEGILGYGSKELLPTLSRGEALVYGPAIDIEKSLVIETIK